MSSVKIVEGWDGVPVELELLSVGLFEEYAASESVLTKWEDSEEIEADGNREDVEIGLPIASWTFDVWTRAEMAYWKTTFGTRVTIETLNRSDNTYHTYNAKMRKLRTYGIDYDTGDFRGVEVLFYDLEEITP